MLFYIKHTAVNYGIYRNWGPQKGCPPDRVVRGGLDPTLHSNYYWGQSFGPPEENLM